MILKNNYPSVCMKIDLKKLVKAINKYIYMHHVDHIQLFFYVTKMHFSNFA